ncbi:inorganic phosphate transporter, PiT family (plasmid) [Legionella adelaidensis]|uniref:Inorganic phosphate transporter, PiT family n=1 Tax=Legionella adelaidensis TaxID=45056 RepID=A0A0W0R190_9GAMM|nr:inorganic phosphate transporter [Legionella adelaidensis]KTC64868.1 low affinity inorganic phosphate transporter [Legionella adelaidensis]VEH82961.1 inorganic phosphate transporter, PiT family [Legionella adelaidensis]
MEQGTFFILFVIFIAFLFDFINGFHDAANSIATIVTTGVLTPTQAVIWAAFFNFIAFLFFHLMVANTIGKDLIDLEIVDVPFLLSALLGAIFWNLLSWYYGIPSSSSHALIGGLAGAALIKAGITSLKPAGFIKVGIGIIISPFLGLFVSLIITFFLKKTLLKQEEEHLKIFKIFQLISSAFLSITHGGNDAQKTMGIIAMVLFSAGWIGAHFYIPFWVVLSCQMVISLGTLAGGWRIVHTMGTKITKLNTFRGCAAEAGAASIIFTATELGIPVSTTQTVTGSIAGVGLVTGTGGIHWPILKVIFLTWLLTVPASALVSALMYVTIR